jgi:hypothetical protein
MAQCPECKAGEITQEGPGVFMCGTCGKKFRTKSKVENLGIFIKEDGIMIKISSTPKELEETFIPYRCSCGSRVVVETFSYPDGIFVTRWNLDLKTPAQGQEDIKYNKLLLMDISCGDCNKLLTKDLQYSFDQEIYRRYGVG